MTKTQIDLLGNRLRKGSISETDLKTLDSYRNSFSEAYNKVIKTLQELELKPTGRPAKSTTSIVDKLHRESIRLSQVQDIAGCRLLVKNIQEQEQIVDRVRNAFSSVSVVDRRIKPNYGYRAVHLIIKNDGKLIEIQVRTKLQHDWAELSEKLSDKLDPKIKYGGGSNKIQTYLYNLSELIQDYEAMEAEELTLTEEFKENFKAKIASLTKFNFE